MKTLKDIKNEMVITGLGGEIAIEIEGKQISLKPALVTAMMVEGAYRQFSVEMAKNDSIEGRNAIVNRWERGYFKASDEKRANPTKDKGANKTAFTREAIMAEIDLIVDAMAKPSASKVLSALKKIREYNDIKFNALLIAVADNPDSIVTQAISQLSVRKATSDLEAQQELVKSLDLI